MNTFGPKTNEHPHPSWSLVDLECKVTGYRCTNQDNINKNKIWKK